MKVNIIGLTDTVITLNHTGIVLKGRVNGIVDVVTDSQKSELNGLKNARLINIELLDGPKSKVLVSKEAKLVQPVKKIETTEVLNLTESPKKQRGRPKGAKNKTTSLEAQQVRQAEAVTQKMGSEVLVSVGDGKFKKVTMKHNFEGQLGESDITRESLETMKRLEEEEQEDNGFDKTSEVIDETKLDASEQNGRKAIVSDMGNPVQANLKNSCVPGAGEVKKTNPFIDGEARAKIAETAKRAFIDSPDITGKKDRNPFVDGTNIDESDEDPFIEK